MISGLSDGCPAAPQPHLGEGCVGRWSSDAQLFSSHGRPPPGPPRERATKTQKIPIFSVSLPESSMANANPLVCSLTQLLKTLVLSETAGFQGSEYTAVAIV